MQSTWWALLLKPVLGLVVAAVFFYTTMLVARLIGRLLPDGKVKEFLFRERWRNDASRAADSDHRLLK